MLVTNSISNQKMSTVVGRILNITTR